MLYNSKVATVLTYNIVRDMSFQFYDFVALARDYKFDLWYNPQGKMWNLTSRDDLKYALHFTRSQLLNMNIERFRWLYLTPKKSFFKNNKNTLDLEYDNTLDLEYDNFY